MSKEQSDAGDVDLAELISQLQQEPAFYILSPEHLREHLERSLGFIELQRAFYRDNEAHLGPHYSASVPVIQELRNICPTVGNISSVIDCPAKEYVQAVPILMKWFPLVDERLTRNEIVRALSSRHARKAASLLVEEFRRESSAEHALRHTISRALEAMADDGLYSDLVELARDRTFGRSRHGIVLGLSKIRNPGVVDLLIELLDDRSVTREVVQALERRVDPRSRAALKPFTSHPDWFVQRYARRAITKIEKKEAKRQRKAQASKEGDP